MRRGEGMVQGSNSGFGPTPRVKVLAEKLHHFMTEKIFPAEAAWEEHAQSKQRFDDNVQSILYTTRHICK